jgi:2,5-diamino-6-(ribosylamino)-4(3H)-pyrimidinone 5'-phosphate reductase
VSIDRRPFVLINMAMTADGKITSAAREYPRFASLEDRRRMDLLRAEADAVLVGAGTLRADNPDLRVRDAEARARRAALGKPAALARVAVSASGRLDGASRFLDDDGAARIVATREGAPEATLAALGAGIEVWRAGRARVDLRALLARLAERGVERLLVEGGGELNWELVRDDLVDELYLTLAPALLGGRDAPTPVEGPGLTMERQRRLRLVSVERAGDELFCRFAVDR